MLGRLGARPDIDIPVDEDGLVAGGDGGMSIAPDSPENLPAHRRPAEHGGTGKDVSSAAIRVPETAPGSCVAVVAFAVRRYRIAKQRCWLGCSDFGEEGE